MARKSITKEYFNQCIEKLFPECIKVIDYKTFKNVHEKIEIQCLKCGEQYEKRINDLLHGYGCRACNFTGIVTKRFRNTESFIIEVDDITHSEYSFIGEYKDTRTKSTFLHNKCKKVFDMKIHNFITLGQRCPYCKIYAKGRRISNGVRDIINFLELNNIEYELEKKFTGLYSDKKSGGLLSFDFFLPKYNVLIEYDGQQHFMPTSIFGGEKYFESLKANDLKKDKWTAANGYGLIRIPYRLKGKIKDKLVQLFHEGSTTIENVVYYFE